MAVLVLGCQERSARCVNVKGRRHFERGHLTTLKLQRPTAQLSMKQRKHFPHNRNWQGTFQIPFHHFHKSCILMNQRGAAVASTRIVFVQRDMAGSREQVGQ